jgi:hypothetical protein
MKWQQQTSSHKKAQKAQNRILVFVPFVPFWAFLWL